jgi:hypothetical protein
MTGTGMTGTGMTGTTAGMSTGDKIKSKIPGTDEYEAVHGADKRHMQAENLKSKVPGTDEHKEAKMMGNYNEPGYDTGMTGAGVGSTTAGMSTGDKIDSKVPGTDEYEAVHGMDKRHMQAENLKSKVPGTDEHKEAKMMGTHNEVGYDTNIGATDYNTTGIRDQDMLGTGSDITGTKTTGYDTGITPAARDQDVLGSGSDVTGSKTYGTGVGGGTAYDNTIDDGTGMHSGVATAGTDTGYGTTTGASDTAYDTTSGYDQYDRAAGEKEGLGHKILKHVPGTAARKEYKAEKAAGETTY